MNFLRLFYTIQVSFSDSENPYIFVPKKREVFIRKYVYLYERLFFPAVFCGWYTLYRKKERIRSYEFNSATKYILLEFGSDSTGSSYQEKTPWTSDELNNIINSFTITKA